MRLRTGWSVKPELDFTAGPLVLFLYPIGNERHAVKAGRCENPPVIAERAGRPRALAKRLGREHIIANAIAPGPFPSRLTVTGSAAVRQSIQTYVLLGRAGEAMDVEGVLVFLASRAGAYSAFFYDTAKSVFEPGGRGKARG